MKCTFHRTIIINIYRIHIVYIFISTWNINTGCKDPQYDRFNDIQRQNTMG